MGRIIAGGLIGNQQENNSEQQQEGWLPYLGRQALGGLEKVAEIPLDINQTLQAANKIIPEAIPLPGRHIINQLPHLQLPTSTEFRRTAEKTLGYEPNSFDPQGPLETIGQEAIKFGTTAGLSAGANALSKGAGLGQAAKTGLQSIKGAIKPSLGAAVGGQLGEGIGNIFDVSEPVKSAMNFVGGLIGGSYGTRSKVTTDVAKNYTLSSKKLPEGASYQSPKMGQVAELLEQKVNKLPGYERIEPTVSKFKNLVANENRVPIQDAIDFKIALNSEYKNYPKKIRDQIINPMINSIKNDVIIPYGTKQNKSFLKPWQTAEKDFAALRNRFIKTDAIVDTSEKILSKYPDQLTLGAKKILGYMVLGSGGYSVYSNPIASTALAGGVVAGNEINKFIGLISQSTTAQKTIKQLARELSLGHSSNAIKILNKLGNELPDINIDEQKPQRRGRIISGGLK